MARSGTVAFHRGRAVAWAVAGVAAFALDLQDSVALVFVASIYANVVSDWGAGEAADDHRILDRLDALERKIDRLLTHTTK